jgi:hypothetical protein
MQKKWPFVVIFALAFAYVGRYKTLSNRPSHVTIADLSTETLETETPKAVNRLQTCVVVASCKEAVLFFAKANARRFYVASDLFPDSSPLKQFTRLLPAIRRIIAATTAYPANQQTTVFIDAGAASYGEVGTVDYSDSLELLSLFKDTRVLVIAYEAQQAKAAELVLSFFLLPPTNIQCFWAMQHYSHRILHDVGVLG